MTYQKKAVQKTNHPKGESKMNMPTINVQQTGLNIRRLMDVNGLVIKDVQNVFGFNTPQAIYKWVHGDSLPTVDNLVVLSAIFGVGIDKILVVERGAGQ